MKGVILTELIEMIEARYSPAVADAVLTPVGLQSGGVYTSVGNYEYAELAELLERLTLQTGNSKSFLLKQLGQHLFPRFLRLYPQFIVGISVFELLARVDDTIHATLKNMHPDAEMPWLRFERLSENVAQFEYRSRRAMADYAEGLIEACIAHFGESITVDRRDLDGEPATHVCFTLTKIARQ
jgi:hypothetical protein